jgi:hypothetical protein
MHLSGGTFSRITREQEELVLGVYGGVSGGFLGWGAAIKIRVKLAGNLTVVLCFVVCIWGYNGCVRRERLRAQLKYGLNKDTIK